MPTIAEIVTEIYPVAEYLATCDIERGGLYGSGVDISLPQKIRNIGCSVKRIYDADPSDSTLFATATYLYGLCGIYGAQAQAISGTGGTIAGVTPSTATLPEPLDFVVSGTSFISTGVSSITIPAFIGYNISFTRNGVGQNTTNTGGTYFSWNRTTGLFKCLDPLSSGAQDGELFRIEPIG